MMQALKWVVSGMLATALLLILSQPLAQVFSTWLYVPVASKMTIVSAEPDGGKGSRGWQLIEWKITKYRDCTFLGMNWQHVRPDGSLSDLDWSQPLPNPQRNKSREAGTHSGIVTRVGSTTPIETWRVTVRHSCNFLLPDVTTVIWPR